MPADSTLIYSLALVTFVLVLIVLVVFRVRAARRLKGRSAFTETHGGTPRPSVGADPKDGRG